MLVVANWTLFFNNIFFLLTSMWRKVVPRRFVLLVGYAPMAQRRENMYKSSAQLYIASYTQHSTFSLGKSPCSKILKHVNEGSRSSDGLKS